MNRYTVYARFRIRASSFTLAAIWAAAAFPASAQAPASSVVPPYRSAFEAYRGWSEPAPANWRAANDTALRLGGHAGQLRAASPGAAEPNPAPDQKQGTAADAPTPGRASKPAGKAP